MPVYHGFGFVATEENAKKSNRACGRPKPMSPWAYQPRQCVVPMRLGHCAAQDTCKYDHLFCKRNKIRRFVHGWHWRQTFKISPMNSCAHFCKLHIHCASSICEIVPQTGKLTDKFRLSRIRNAGVFLWPKESKI